MQFKYDNSSVPAKHPRGGSSPHGGGEDLDEVIITHRRIAAGDLNL